jgi:hypothetical protein
MHVHFGPLPIPPGITVTHSVTAVEAAREAAAADFRAIVLKAKDSSTAGLCHVVEELVEGIQVFGGVVLDHAVGGLNPIAVEEALRLGGKIVWLPTCGIPVIDRDAKVLPVVHEIFELVAAHDALLATGHITVEEHFAVARQFGGSGRLIVTHAGAQTNGPALDARQCAELAELGATLEFAALTTIDHWGKAAMALDEHAAMIRAAGVERSLLASDYGWNDDLPRPVQGMREYYERLWKVGFTEDELRLMACETPARLLRLAG